MKDIQLIAVYNCLEYVIDKDYSYENYLDASKILIKANLNWLIGDKEYK